MLGAWPIPEESVCRWGWQCRCKQDGSGLGQRGGGGDEHHPLREKTVMTQDRADTDPTWGDSGN